MKLSEAISLGSTMHPQGFGHYQLDGKTCAMGAAACAVSIHVDYDEEIVKPWPWLSIPAECPVCAVNDSDGQDFLWVIIHLNDEHMWTREKIAAWVATIEPKDAQQVSEKVTVSPLLSQGNYA